MSINSDGDTRRRILITLLEGNPASSSDIAAELGLSAAAVRRHMDILVEDGLVESAPAPVSGPRGRGRPAKTFRLTDDGRAEFGHGYDELAVAALRTLKEIGGEAAVTAFARQRIDEILGGVRPASAGGDPQQIAEEVVEAFRKHGYAAHVQENRGSLQICHRHCPISNVASDFPELCEAEQQAVSTLLGQHTQRLATIADGNGVCTTNIPISPINRPPAPEAPTERSGQ